MIEIRKQGVFTHLYATEGYLHRKGGGYARIRRMSIYAPETADDYEEVGFGEYEAVELELYRQKEYKRRLAEAIHERYSLDDEIALAANINSPMLLADEAEADAVAGEYAAYQQFRAECKARIRAEVDAITEVPGERRPGCHEAFQHPGADGEQDGEGQGD